MDETAPKQDIAPASAAGTEAKKSPENPISAAISTLIHKLHDFEECADKKQHFLRALIELLTFQRFLNVRLWMNSSAIW
ncbi:MAG: hypothetical protein DME36_05955 [Verrucomicrobia bacterium]|nr:MAG: hypothetical protein DME36_05955 [Verrucomicrobiota bacterium]